MNLLIVDDEYYSAEGTKNKIIQNSTLFDEVFCAYNITQAMEYLTDNKIAIMILDIEMPGGSGLELLDQVRQKGMDIICIFLTAYANFDYISTAMKLTSFDYLLKPVETQALLDTVKKAADQYWKQHNAKITSQQAVYWKESELYLWELFWLDFTEGAISSRTEDLVSELRIRNLNPAAVQLSYHILLIQCNRMENLPIEKNFHEFLLKNIVREYFYKKEEIPVVVRQSRSFYFLPLPSAGRTRESLLARCAQAMTDFVPRFPNTFNFYVSASACTFSDFLEQLQQMRDIADKNVALENHVFDLALSDEKEDSKSDVTFSTRHWTDLLLSGKFDSLRSETDLFLHSLSHSPAVTRDTLSNFYYTFMQTMFSCMETVSPDTLPLFRSQLARFSTDAVCSSLQNVRDWVTQVLQLYEECVSDQANSDNAVTTVKNYIHTHLNQELTRESLASIVYLTPDYLSHLFKNETGFSLTNYIIYERIEEAKRMLAGTDLTISEIATRCGFQNISYFSRQFRRFTGVTPREFRG